MLSDELERSAFEANIRSTWRVPADYLDWALKVKDGAYQDSRAQDQWSGWLSKARAIEREATAPLIEQIKEDEALMRDVFNAYENGVGMIAAINAIRQRLESKK